MGIDARGKPLGRWEASIDLFMSTEMKPVEKDTIEPLTSRWAVLWAIVIVVQCGISGVLGWTINGAQYGLWAPLLCHGLQWIVFIHAYLLNTEMFFDLTGSLTFISTTLLTLLWMPVGYGVMPHPRCIVASVLAVVWASRLGCLLFSRIRAVGEDKRFRQLKANALTFFGVWNYQGIWVFVTGLSVWSVNSRPLQPDWTPLDVVGICVWAYGFAVEVVADHQKTVWRRNPANKGQYIDVGLWKYSRHPNYFGEFMLWLGQFVLCASAFVPFPADPESGSAKSTMVAAVTARGLLPEPGMFPGCGFLCVLSPLFVYVLLRYVSGVPMLEAGADKRWGHDEAYQAYKRETQEFFLLPWPFVKRTEASTRRLHPMMHSPLSNDAIQERTLKYGSTATSTSTADA